MANRSGENRSIELSEIASKMKECSLPSAFIAEAIRLAREYEGVSDLLMIWAKENDSCERQEIIADIQDAIDDCAQDGK